MTATTAAPAGPSAPFSEETWSDVLSAVDRTYAELVSYQEQLEHQNAELDGLRAFMASVLESISDVLVVIDRSGVIEQASGSLGRLLGQPVRALIGQPFDSLLTDDTRPALVALSAQVIRSRAAASAAADLETPEGPAPLDIRIAPRLDPRGKSKGAVLTGRPMGELRRAYSELEASHDALKEAQAHLVRNEKLASLGRLLAGVAHELNNPISFVYANTHALEKYADRLETYFHRVQAGASRDELIRLRADLRLDRQIANMRTAIDGARDGAERVRDIVQDLRRLSSEGAGPASEMDLSETARVAVDWVIRGSKRKLSVQVDAPPRLLVCGRQGHIQQVIMNLVQNAVDAMADTTDPQLWINVRDIATGARVEVRDNGPGIPDTVAGSVFDPFFTTKPVGKGTGLGLSISNKIAEEHGGTLQLCTKGPGACFRLDLPRRPPAALLDGGGA